MPINVLHNICTTVADYEQIQTGKLFYLPSNLFRF